MNKYKILITDRQTEQAYEKGASETIAELELKTSPQTKDMILSALCNLFDSYCTISIQEIKIECVSSKRVKGTASCMKRSTNKQFPYNVIYLKETVV